jgi:hypothetical protein
VASLSACDIEQVGMSIIALLGIARGGMAIDAAGVCEHRIHLLPRGQTLRATDRRVRLSRQGGDEADGQGENHGSLAAVHVTSAD